uniref:Uncharacterized protein n=1 Tax=Oryza rufipogon TaxID=4529 RepID=A0A0E0NP76_ORYRU
MLTAAAAASASACETSWPPDGGNNVQGPASIFSLRSKSIAMSLSRTVGFEGGNILGPDYLAKRIYTSIRIGALEETIRIYTINGRRGCLPGLRAVGPSRTNKLTVTGRARSWAALWPWHGPINSDRVFTWGIGEARNFLV